MKYINGHKILSVNGNTFWIICGTCGRYTNKTKSKVYQNKGCRHCNTRSKKTNLKIRCEILGLHYPTILSRTSRGWSVNAALYQDRNWTELEEKWSEKDLKYINEFYTKHYNKDKQLADSANNKYRLKRFKNII